VTLAKSSLAKRRKVSVTDLANFACRQGDLSPDAVVGPSAREGMRAHKALQGQRKRTHGEPEWLVAEFAVNFDYDFSDETNDEPNALKLRVGGRIDLVDTRAPRLTEIKTTLVPATEIPDAQRALQWAQLYLYGYIYAQQQAPSAGAIELELVHINIRAQTQESDLRLVSVGDLNEFADRALSVYAQWIQLIQERKQQLVNSTKELEFPFARFRDGQRDMAVAVYRSARDATPLLCEAPTGIGKTMSSLYPALKVMGENELHQLVYLSAKVSGQRSASEAIDKLCRAGLNATVISIRSKELTCFCSNGRCERDANNRCPMTLGFFDRLPQAQEELLSLGVIKGDSLDEVAWEHQLCPFELALQLLPWVQIVIADYNYVFDPLVRLAHFSASNKSRVLLVDEAHNLVDRSRSMFSAELSRLMCMVSAEESRQSQPLLAVQLDKLSKRLMSVVSDKNEMEVVTTEPPTSLLKTINLVLEQMSVAIAQGPSLGKRTTELWKALCRYVVIADLFSDRHRCIVSMSKVGNRREVRVVLFCLDASKALASSYQSFRVPVIFSATLRPASFYQDTLGLGSEVSTVQLASPFSAHKCLRAVVDWVDTRYRYRQSSLSDLVALIHECTDKRAGNYIVFFPSYAYLEQAHGLFNQLYPEQLTWVQARGQARSHHEQLLAQLDTAGHRVGFAIQGGVLGEGIDYRGDRLIGTIVVGTGLPGTDRQSELISEHFTNAGHNGYDFAYRYPGFTRVLQTAGRVIRSESDTGFVLLVDHRFRQRQYRQLFPSDWVVKYPGNLKQLEGEIDLFWKTRDQPVSTE